MKRLLLIIGAALLLATTATAQPAQAILDRAIAAVDRAGGITASYTVSGNDLNHDGDKSTISGRVAMRGTRFAMLATELKCWYNGKTQWTYSTATGEVNITTPTAAELQMTNPLATLRGLKTGFVATRAANSRAGYHTLQFTPKTRSDIKQLTIDFDAKTSLPARVQVNMRDSKTATITVTNVKTGVSLPASTFTFDKRLVPDGTPVVDLR